MFFILEPEDRQGYALYYPLHPLEVYPHHFYNDTVFILHAEQVIPKPDRLISKMMETQYFKRIHIRPSGNYIHVHLAYPTRFPLFCMNELHRYYDEHLELVTRAKKINTQKRKSIF